VPIHGFFSGLSPEAAARLRRICDKQIHSPPLEVAIRFDSCGFVFLYVASGHISTHNYPKSPLHIHEKYLKNETRIQRYSFQSKDRQIQN